ncbi:MAG TPA: DUF2062 domain-containing protein [Prosthecobacter sp.]|nr:DUF2062 domain-containing protein [Prosthecobacter sp.]
MISSTLQAFQRQWFRFRRGVKSLALRVFRVKDASERVARGFALGMVINFIPTFGLGVLVSGFVARIFGGNVIAGLAGGASLTFFWPFLFFLNLRMGGLLVRPEIEVDEVADINEKSMNALMWGKSFILGMSVNIILAGIMVYLLVFFLHARLRPAALAWFRRRRLRRSQEAA